MLIEGGCYCGKIRYSFNGDVARPCSAIAESAGTSLAATQTSLLYYPKVASDMKKASQNRLLDRISTTP